MNGVKTSKPRVDHLKKVLIKNNSESQLKDKTDKRSVSGLNRMENSDLKMKMREELTIVKLSKATSNLLVQSPKHNRTIPNTLTFTSPMAKTQTVFPSSHISGVNTKSDPADKLSKSKRPIVPSLNFEDGFKQTYASGF